MGDIIKFVQENWVNILAIIGAVDIILGIVVAWTPAQWDNNLYAIIHKAILGLLKKKE